MYQQHAPQPRDESSWNSPQPEYEAGYIGTPQQEVGYAGNAQQNDQLADAIARRLQVQVTFPQQTPASPTPKGYSPFIISAGQRLALAIVSVCVLIPIAAIALGILGTEGLIAFGFAGLIILGINYLFNQK